MSDNLDNTIKEMFGSSVITEEVVEVTDNSMNEEYVKQIESLKNKVKELEDALASKEVCRRCGRELGTSPLAVTDSVAEEYFRCLLGQRPFEKTFNLFGGRLRLTFRELSGDSIIENNRTITKAESDDEFADVLEMYLVTGMLVKVETFDEATMRTETLYDMTDDQLIENTKDPKAAYDNLLRTVGQMKIAVIRRTCTIFEYLLSALIEKGQDPNFYEDAGLL